VTTERPEQRPEAFLERRLSRGERRRARIAEELRRNREGNHTVPTWVLAAILGLLLAGWITLIVVS
jgi:hypothetical protein